MANLKKIVVWTSIAAVLVLITAGIICLMGVMGDSSKPGINADEKSSTDDIIGKENVLKHYEAVVASAQIHGYELQLIYSPLDKKQTVMDDLMMYTGNFELRTSKDSILCAVLPFKSGETDNHFPVEGFDLIVKDYDGDGNKDDFFIGQGQLPHMGGNCMAHWLYTVEEDGSMKQYGLSGNLLTMPNFPYSGDFEYKDGKIQYQGFGEAGNSGLQTEEVTGIVQDSSDPKSHGNEEVQAVTGQETAEKEYEAVLAKTQIHGYELRFVYSPKNREMKKTDGMYEGEFELRTYKENILCETRRLKGKSKFYYPEEGFDLALKDYDGDGDADDFSIGQGETMIPKNGKSMVYWIFSVNEDGSIWQCRMDNEDEDCLKTFPSYNFSKEFECQKGKIYYIGFNDKGEMELKDTEVAGHINDLVKTLE